MDSWIYYFISLPFSLLSPIIIAGIVYLIVRLRNDRQSLTPYRALTGYFHVMIGAGVITMAVGVIFFARVAISQAYDGGGVRDDLIAATGLLCTGLVICLLHIYGRDTMQKTAEENTGDIRRIYLFSMLGISGLVGLITIPLAIVQITRYYIVDSPYHSAPSSELAVAIVFVILWAYFISRVIREVRLKNGQ